MTTALTAATPTQRPNFLILLADDLGFSDIGCYGGEIATPNLDRLAAGGLRFTQFYNTSRCWPTRSALLTGYYPQQIRMDPPKGRLPAWAKLLPHYLKPLGYRCYHSGKWHVPGAPKVVADGGFDHSYVLDDHNRNFYPRDHSQDDRPLPAVSTNAGYYTTVAFADHAIRCLREHAAEHPGEPFFSYLAFTVPHFPLHAPAEDIARYRDRYLAGWDVVREQRWKRLRRLGIVRSPLSAREPDGVPYWNLKESELRAQIGPGEVGRAVDWRSLTTEQRRFQAEKMAIHAAMIDRMDREIGRVIDQLKAMRAFDNTVILFASDNGASAEQIIRGDNHDATAPLGSGPTFLCLGPGWSSAANSPFRLHKSWVHEGGIATPFIVHWPEGVRGRGQLRHDPGHIIDIVPTLLELAGAPRLDDSPDLRRPSLPGRSLVPAFARDHSVSRDWLFFNHDDNHALRMGDWKLVATRANTNAWQLYDLRRDRCETKDLAASQPERVQQMAAKWAALEAEFRRQPGPAEPAANPPATASLSAIEWSTKGPIVGAAPADGEAWLSVKDPSVVRHGDRWHLFCTVRGSQRSHAIVYSSFADWPEADAAPRRVLPCHPGYFCAPQVFYFTPHQRWYLICQASAESWTPKYQPAFTTTTNVADPESWAPLQPMWPNPETAPKAWLDFWVICDAAKAHLFFTSLDGKMWRAETPLDRFPLGWSAPVLALEGDVFEASHTYRLRGRNQFLTVIEAQNGNGWRYFKSYLADRLEGPWQPLAATKENAFASMRNLTQSGRRWTDSVSHGELLRTGNDERLEVDPAHLRLLIQGVLDADRADKPYGQIPWRLGLLEARP